MNGIEKITERIIQDAKQEIDEITSEAQRQAKEIADKYSAAAEREKDEILARGRSAAAERIERLAVVAMLDAKKLELAAKQECLVGLFDLAMEKLIQMPGAAVCGAFSESCGQRPPTGKEQIILSQKDRTRFGKRVVTEANAILAKKYAPELPEEIKDTKGGAVITKVVAGANALISGGASLSLSEESRPMKGGLMLSDGDIEINCTFESQLRLLRSEIATEVAGVLFN
jgi:V/A-type H+-transporting ATPase subunit E